MKYWIAESPEGKHPPDELQDRIVFAGPTNYYDQWTQDPDGHTGNGEQYPLLTDSSQLNDGTEMLTRAHEKRSSKEWEDWKRKVRDRKRSIGCRVIEMVHHTGTEADASAGVAAAICITCKISSILARWIRACQAPAAERERRSCGDSRK